ncbi:peptide-methionine (R)-S-oxide reductase MsrB [Schleiferiaceae bacterium]|nr:peptide-methionine (R)-S-oxide reductase MsrB [Schleiferiaceae bacterium]
MKKVLYILTTTLFLTACQGQETNSTMGNADNTSFPVEKTEQEWKAQLSAEEYFVIRKKGTERPYTGEYNMHFDEGTYTCRGCDTPLFTSDSKFDSHCGWPSFDQGIAKGAILEKLDKTHGMMRTEIVCASCGGHLGHVFNDGPTATGLRYCVNSLSIDFKEENEE